MKQLKELRFVPIGQNFEYHGEIYCCLPQMVINLDSRRHTINCVKNENGAMIASYIPDGAQILLK